MTRPDDVPPGAPCLLAALTGRDREQPATVEWTEGTGCAHLTGFSCYDAALELAREVEDLLFGRADRIVLADGGIVDGPLLRREIEHGRAARP
jgi:hypothetical protein